ncbi:hypothetical protein ACFYY8_26940, partial [Streptosporangium sp. NPDC001559]|uniref:hypothetical protein n=1 Tax=Streptosporangium sp. NPDC001559 TaxID=3366187 RepID=UPI0036EAB402
MSRLALAVTVALIPSLLTMEAQAVIVDPSPARLAIPDSPSSGSVDKTPVQISGSAEKLPHLVDPAVTQPQGKGKPDHNGKRPKGALPLETPHEVTDEPAAKGLKKPPPLTWESSPTANWPANDRRPNGVHTGAADTRNGSPRALDSHGGKEQATQAVSAVAAGALPVVSDLSASPGQSVAGLWTLASVQPSFSAYGGDADSRQLRLEAQVEHDPGKADQGTGLIWSGAGDLSTSTCYTTSKCWLQTPTVTSGKLKDGWLIRWRLRVLTSSGVAGAWSTWQAGRVDTTKPVVSELSASPGQSASGLWTLASAQPSFSAYGGDPDSRQLRLEAQVEHDPGKTDQGMGLIWSGAGDLSTGTCYTTSKCWIQTPTVTSGKLKDGWLVRWRVRA